MLSRRAFIKKTLIAGGLVSLGQYPWSAWGQDQDKLIIIHTNDTHSRLDPFPKDGSIYEGMGGVAARAAIINAFRAKYPHVLLVDAGDMFQGTPYFNAYKGRLELEAMSKLGYEAATMGNHEFDLGLEGFRNALPYANFPFITSNYNFNGTVLEDKTFDHHIIQKGKVTIGIIGLGVNPVGLIPESTHRQFQYLNPINIANAKAKKLKKQGCELVIVLSHIGYSYNNSYTPSDLLLAKNSQDIDIIIGGHTHTFLDKPTIIINLKNKPVVVNQVGWGGIKIGILEWGFYKHKSGKLLNGYTVIPNKQTIAS
jgi:5'-nucleotidase